jgi:hypothetical protein
MIMFSCIRIQLRFLTWIPIVVVLAITSCSEPGVNTRTQVPPNPTRPGIHCYEPPPAAARTAKTDIKVDAAVQALEPIIKGAGGFSRDTQIQKLREVSEEVNGFEVIEFRICNAAASGQVTQEQYGRLLELAMNAKLTGRESGDASQSGKDTALYVIRTKMPNILNQSVFNLAGEAFEFELRPDGESPLPATVLPTPIEKTLLLKFSIPLRLFGRLLPLVAIKKPIELPANSIPVMISGAFQDIEWESVPSENATGLTHTEPTIITKDEAHQANALAMSFDSNNLYRRVRTTIESCGKLYKSYGGKFNHDELNQYYNFFERLSSLRLPLKLVNDFFGAYIVEAYEHPETARYIRGFRNTGQETALSEFESLAKRLKAQFPERKDLAREYSRSCARL